MKKLVFKNADLLHLCIHKSEHLIAAVGRRSALIMHYDTKLTLIQHFLDEDKAENLMSAQFLTIMSEVFLCLGGESGILKIMNVTKHRFMFGLNGHGAAITQIQVHTINENIVFTSSEDTTVRMWDIIERRCVGIFGGYIGHRDYVLTIDVSLCGTKLLSAGTDCTIKVWEIPNKVSSFVKSVYFPLYSTSRLHKSYITCVRFYGDLIASKSSGNRIVFVKPDYSYEIYNSNVNSDSMFVDEYKPTIETVIVPKFDIFNNILVVCVKKAKSEFLFFDCNMLSSEFAPFYTVVKEFGVRDFVLKGNDLFILYDNSDLEWVCVDIQQKKPSKK